MKKLLFAAIVAVFASCGNPQPSYEVQWNQGGNDSVVYVHYVDDRGRQQDFFMDYLLFTSLYGNGGYNNVYHYYYTNPSTFRGYNDRYNSYSSSYVPRTSRYYNSYSHRVTPYSNHTNSNSPSYNTGTKRTVAPYSNRTQSNSPSYRRPTYTPTRTYTPARSSSSNSPSRRR